MYPSLLNATGGGCRLVVLASGLDTTRATSRPVVSALAPDCRIARCDHVGTPGADLAARAPVRHETRHGHADDAGRVGGLTGEAVDGGLEAAAVGLLREQVVGAALAGIGSAW